MTDEADFTVRLIDKVKGPARSAKKSIEGLIGANKRLAKTEKSVTRAEKALGLVRDKNGRLRSSITGRYVGGAGGGRRGSGGGGMFDILKGNLLTSAVMKVGELVGNISRAAFEMATFGQNTRMAFGNLAKHGATADDLFGHASALATRFGLDLVDTTNQYKKFLQLQFSPKAADKMIRMGADLQALGTSAEDVQGVFTALGQIKGKGKLQGDELLQLAERGISIQLVNEEIGKLLGGKTNDEVQKLQSKGKITADVALEAIEKALNRKLGQSKLGESGAKFADETIAGMLGRFKALGQKAALGMFDKVAAPLTKLLGKGLAAFEGFLTSPEGEATIQRVADALESAAYFAKDFAMSFGEAFSADFKARVLPILNELTGSDLGSADAKELGKQFATVATNVAQAVALISRLALKIGEIANGPLGDLLGITVGGAVKGQTAVLEAVASSSKTFGDDSKSLKEKALGIGTDISSGLYEGIKNGTPIGWIAQLGGMWVDELKDVLQIHSPSRVTRAIGVNVGKGLALGADSTVPLLLASGDRMGSASLSGMEDRLYGPPTRSARMGAPAVADPVVSRAGASFHIPITVNVHGGGNAEETARSVGPEVRRELEAALRQWALEVGA